MVDDNYYNRNRAEMLAFLPKSFNNALEIGCGQGEFGKLVKKTHNIYYTGIEAEHNSALIAKKNLDLVLEGDVFEQLQSLPDDYFDLIICNDVIEHILSPDILLKSLRKKMKSDGYLICSFPNFRVLDNLIHILITKDFRYEDWGVRDKTHLRFYTKKSMARLLNENGFSILKISGINPIKSLKIGILLRLLFLVGHGDIRFPQFGITATYSG